VAPPFVSVLPLWLRSTPRLANRRCDAWSASISCSRSQAGSPCQWEGTEELTHTGDIVGTLRYMAPERFRGKSDPRSKVYGLGITLYELARAATPFPQMSG
jgi:serine/threonine protein kinase